MLDIITLARTYAAIFEESVSLSEQLAQARAAMNYEYEAEIEQRMEEIEDTTKSIEKELRTYHKYKEDE